MKTFPIVVPCHFGLEAEMCIRDRLGYHPCVAGFLTCARDPGGGQCQAGSLTGADVYKRQHSE